MDFPARHLFFRNLKASYYQHNRAQPRRHVTNKRIVRTVALRAYLQPPPIKSIMNGVMPFSKQLAGGG
jgi:hypothetical protein